jgi:hypothetical protein
VLPQFPLVALKLLLQKKLKRKKNLKKNQMRIWDSVSLTKRVAGNQV